MAIKLPCKNEHEKLITQPCTVAPKNSADPTAVAQRGSKDSPLQKNTLT